MCWAVMCSSCDWKKTILTRNSENYSLSYRETEFEPGKSGRNKPCSSCRCEFSCELRIARSCRRCRHTVDTKLAGLEEEGRMKRKKRPGAYSFDMGACD